MVKIRFGLWKNDCIVQLVSLEFLPFSLLWLISSSLSSPRLQQMSFTCCLFSRDSKEDFYKIKKKKKKSLPLTHVSLLPSSFLTFSLHLPPFSIFLSTSCSSCFSEIKNLLSTRHDKQFTALAGL